MNPIDHYLYSFSHESPSLLSLPILLECYHTLCNIQQEKGYLHYERIIQVVEYILHQHNHFVHPSDVKNLLQEVYVALLSEALISSDIDYLATDGPYNLQMKTYLIHYDEFNFVQIIMDVLQSHYYSLMRSESSTKDMHFFSQQRHPMIAELEFQALNYSSQHQKETMRSHQQQHFVGGNSQRPQPYPSHHNTANNAKHYSNNNIPIPIAPALSNKFHQFANNDRHFHHATTTNHQSSFNNQSSFGNFSTRVATGSVVDTSSLPAPGWFIF